MTQSTLNTSLNTKLGKKAGIKMSYTLEELQILLNLLQESLTDIDDLANTEPLLKVAQRRHYEN